jgi:hypothetical protein
VVKQKSASKEGITAGTPQKDFIDFVSDATNSPPLLKQFAECKTAQDLADFFDGNNVMNTIYSTGTNGPQRIFDEREKLGMDEWPLPPFY